MISRIELTNFKIFPQQEIAIAPLTLLTGVNGSGKSSVMQALAMLRQSYDTGFLDRHSWLLNGELVELGNGADVLHDNPIDQGEMSVTLTSRSRAGGESSVGFPVRYDSKGDVLVSTLNLLTPIAPLVEFNLFGTGFQYLRADRITPAVTYPKSQYAVSTRRFLGSRGEFTAHFLLEYGDHMSVSTNLLSPDVAAPDKLLTQTNAWMQKFSPSVVLDVENIRHTDFVQLRYSYRTQGIGGGGGIFRATNVGFGLSYSLPIVVACLAAQPGDLLLLENPEAHLHPEGQLAMGELMARAASNGVQILVESHSDHVLNGIRLAVKRKILSPEDVAFRFFRRDDSGAANVQTPTIDRDGMLSDWPAGFFTQWDDALVQLLS